MITRQELEGSWNDVKGKIQSKWGQLTDDDLSRVKGDANQLIGFLQQKTGETRRSIEEFLDKAKENGAGVVQQAMDSAREYAGQARQMASDHYDQAVEGLQTGVEEAQRMVRRNPMESIAVAFGAGMIAGVVTGLILKSSRS
jgi:uncharacterized protein YjbJ (UPF0337 family)